MIGQTAPIHLALAAAVVLLAAGPGWAADSYFQTGNSLYALCQSDQSFVAAYMVGSADAFSINFKGQKGYICLPANVTSNQLSDMMCRFLRDAPEKRHTPANGLAYQMLLQNFRCPD